MSKLFFIFCLFIGSISSAFETTGGNYIGQQDALQLLTDIFYGDKLPSNTYDLSGCVTYREPMGSNDKDLYELGFNNVESGERLVQTPDAAYVLHFDTCVSKIVKQLLQFYSEASMKRLLSDSGYQELDKWRAAYYQQNANVSGNAYFYSMNREWIVQNQAKLISTDVQEKLIQGIFLNVFGAASLIPKDYIDESKKELLDQSTSGSMTIEQFIANVYKKAIINDYLLKY